MYFVSQIKDIIERLNDAEYYQQLNICKLNPWRDGSAREPLTPWKRQNNLKSVAPGQLRKIFCMFKSGCKILPLDLLESVPTAEGQYALMMAWYKLLGVDRPCVKSKNRITPNQVKRLRELRKTKLTYKEIRTITGVPLTTIERYSKDIIEKPDTHKVNFISKQEYGKYFCHLNKYQQNQVITIANNV